MNGLLFGSRFPQKFMRGLSSGQGRWGYSKGILVGVLLWEAA